MAPQPSPDRPLTYADYLTWDGDSRFELLDGAAVAMTPAPDLDHQEVLAELLTQLRTAFRGQQCRAFAAPFDVRLPEGDEADEEIRTVVQPDIAVVCDPAKLDRRGCRGGPDWVIEILSPGTAARDQIEKRLQYEKHGVREYWLVHPRDRVVTRYSLGENGAYGAPVISETQGTVRPRAVSGVEVSWDLVFARVPLEGP